MSTATEAHQRAGRRPLTGRMAVIVSIVAAAVVACILDAVIAAIAHGAGVSHSFRPLYPAGYIVLSVIGIIAGALGWSLIRSRAADPARLLSRLVPTVLMLSFIPDILVGLHQSSMTGASWGGVIALICMHVVVAIAAVVSYRRFLPVGKVSGS